MTAKRADVIRQSCFFRRDEVGKRPARLAAFPVCLLAKEVESLQHRSACVVRVQLDIVTNGVGGKKSVYAARRDQILLNDAIQKSIAFGEYLPRLCTMLRMIEECGDRRLSVPRCGRTATSR